MSGPAGAGVPCPLLSVVLSTHRLECAGIPACSRRSTVTGNPYLLLHARILAGIVSLNPSSSKLPGGSEIEQLASGIGWWALIASLVGLVLGAAAWALGSHTNNYQYSTSGRRAVVVSALAALVIGAAPELISFLFGAGQAMKCQASLAVLGLGRLLHDVARDAVRLWFATAVRFVAHMDAATVRSVWTAVDRSTEPVLSGSGFTSELSTMSVIATAVMVPLLAAAAIQAVARQDPSSLLRTAFIRVPLSLLLTGAAVGIVAMGVSATDQACGALMHGARGQLEGMFSRMHSYLGASSPATLSLNFLCLVLTGLFAFAVWIELAVRSGAVAVATLFLPLALAGSALPATAHWPRRLGETLAALVLSKLVIVAVLALAVGMVTDPRGGVSAIVEGLVLFALSAIATFALTRLLPMVEAGALAHLDGLGRRTVHSVSPTASSSFAWITGAGSGGGGGGRPPGQEGAPGGAPPGPRGGSGPQGGGLPERPPSSPHPMPPPPAAAPAAADPRGTAPGANPLGTSPPPAGTSLPLRRPAPAEVGP